MKKKFFGILKDYSIMTLACFIFAMAWEGFMIPSGMSSGGLMGLCTLIQYGTDGFLQASVLYIAINVVLILVSILLLGLGFGFRTVYCILMSSAMFELVSKLGVLHCVDGGFFWVQERVLIPIISGILEAVGVGLILKRGGSTGGTDIVAIMINKYWPVSLSRVFLICDFVIISMMLLLPGKTFSDMMYGFEMMLTFSVMIDVVVAGNKTSYQLLIFSEHSEDIADYIGKELGRGVTLVHSQGWFTRKEKNVLLVIIRKKQLPSLTRTIKDIDPKAFMSISKVGSVYGEGFEEIKAGFKKKKNG